MQPDEWRLFTEVHVRQEDAPYAHDLIEVRRGTDGPVEVVKPSDLRPEFNVFNLYWRPALASKDAP